MSEHPFLAESVAAVRKADTYDDLHRIYAQRITALILDGGDMQDLRTLAQAWLIRNNELLARGLDH